MAAKIEINAELTESAELLYFFQKYKEHSAIVASMPAAWKKTAAESKKHADNEEAATEATKERLTTMDQLHATMSKFHQLSVSTAQIWLKMQRDTLNVAGNIASATSSLLKWAGVTALIGSVVGSAGGLFGMDELASRVSGRRTSAMGLGTSYGAQESFNLNYSRYGDASGILTRASEAKSSVNKRSAFRAMGFSDQEIDTMDPTELAAQFMERTAQRSQKETDPSHLEDWMRSRGIDKVMDVHTLQNLQSEGARGRAQVYDNFRRDTGRFSLKPEEQRSWQTLNTALRGASDAIEHTFIRALGALNPILTRLSQAFMRIVDDLLPQASKDGPIARWLTSFSTWIEDTAKYLEGTGSKTSLVSFFEGLKAVGLAVWDFVKKAWEFAKKLGFVDSAAAAAYEGNTGAFGGIGTGIRGRAGLGLSDSGGGANDNTSAVTGGKGGRFQDALANVESSNRNIFSKTDPDTAGPGTRSQGYYQIGVPTWRQFADAAGVDLRKYPTPMSAPREVQEQVANAIPFGRFGPRTRHMLESQFGFSERDKGSTVGELGKRYNKDHPAYTPNTQTVIKIRPAAGASPATSAGAAVAGSSGSN